MADSDSTNMANTIKTISGHGGIMDDTSTIGVTQAPLLLIVPVLLILPALHY